MISTENTADVLMRIKSTIHAIGLGYQNIYGYQP